MFDLLQLISSNTIFSDGCKEEVMLGRQKDAHKSLLSRQLDLCKDIDLNYFSDYSHVAGADSEADSKQIRIFFSMRQKTADGTLPFIRTKVNSNAKVINVIGFICYLYTKENMQPQLQPNVDAYSLYLGKPFDGKTLKVLKCTQSKWMVYSEMGAHHIFVHWRNFDELNFDRTVFPNPLKLVYRTAKEIFLSFNGH